MTLQIRRVKLYQWLKWKWQKRKSRRDVHRADCSTQNISGSLPEFEDPFFFFLSALRAVSTGRHLNIFHSAQGERECDMEIEQIGAQTASWPAISWNSSVAWGGTRSRAFPTRSRGRPCVRARARWREVSKFNGVYVRDNCRLRVWQNWNLLTGGCPEALSVGLVLSRLLLQQYV